MKTEISASIRITDPSKEILNWCKTNLIISNPNYIKKKRMGLWTGNEPKTISLYKIDGDTLELPFGVLRQLIIPILEGHWLRYLKQVNGVNYHANVNLYEYQQKAVSEMLEAKYGILQAPTGSGKTQMGIAMAVQGGYKTLWITHTTDLLNQSKERAERYIDKGLIGTITAGKVQIGKGITFATIQTLSRLNLSEYKYMWDCVIVDECHHVAGTPTTVTQYYKVLNVLASPHKFGLSATVHRTDGLIRATYALLGQVMYTVSDDEVAYMRTRVTIKAIATGIPIHISSLNPDGTLNYQRMISSYAENPQRNEQIISCLIDNSDHYNLVLSERVAHLYELYDSLPDVLKEQATVIDGKMTSKTQKAKRIHAIEDMRNGTKHYLFATYSLCKEGLDIQRLDRLYLTTPQKDYAVIAQSIGRIARTHEDKTDAIAYDFVDNSITARKAYKRRCTTYRKCGCEIVEGEG